LAIDRIEAGEDLKEPESGSKGEKEYVGDVRLPRMYEKIQKRSQKERGGENDFGSIGPQEGHQGGGGERRKNKFFAKRVGGEIGKNGKRGGETGGAEEGC